MAVIEIKAYFDGWYETTPRNAYEFVMQMYYGMTGLPHDKKIKCINEKHLRGITFEKLRNMYK